MTMKKNCPQCGGKLGVVDVPLGFGYPVSYLCENGHKVEGHKRIYTQIAPEAKWTHSPLKVVEKWSRWDEDLSEEFVNPETHKPIQFPLVCKD